MIRRVSILAAVMLVSVLISGAAAQVDAPLVTSRYRPSFQFRTITAGNIDIYFHQGEESLAQRLANIVEEVAPAVDRRLGAPRGRVRVILVDQTDVSNGWATVVPYNLIEIAAVPPPSASEIGNTDDWLRLVFTHEYTHVLHLEKSGGWLGSLRRVFGRLPLFYSNLFVPSWQIEGLATFEESALTGQGRVRAGDFRMMLQHAKASGRFAPLDRATTAVIDWPGGTSAYLYGAFFHEFLAERYGEASLARLSDETAGRLPFFGSLAFKEVYGKSLGELWTEFAAQVATPARKTIEAPPRPPVRLTRHGFTVTSPALTPDGRLFYSIANPHGFPALMELVDGEPREVTSRYHGRRLAAARDLLVYDQLELSGHVALQSDLYTYDLRSRRTRRVTSGMRAADPDVTPDGQRIVCTIQETGRRMLATVTADANGSYQPPVVLVSEDATEFSSPRWSPDGRRILAERRRLGGRSELVLVDAQTGDTRVLFAPPTGRVVTPAWAVDDLRVLFSWDRDGGPFTLYFTDVDPVEPRQIVEAGDGAEAPVVSSDGRRMVFVAYTPDGYDLFSMDLVASWWGGVTLPEPAPATSGELRDPAPTRATRNYSPLGTLAPRAWSPYFERDGDDTVVGAALAGFDALGRHTYVVSAGWGMPRNRPDVQAEYTYARWWPALFAGVSDDTDARRDGFIRSRDAGAGVLFPFRRVRWTSDVLGAMSYSTDELIDADDDVTARRERTAGRVGIRLSNAKAYGYSISGEEGATVAVVAEFARGDNDTGTARTFVADARGYLPVFPRHGVIALRTAFATSRGDERVRREFTAGGSGPQGAGFDVGVDAIGLLRGYDDADVFGRSAAVINADYRIPIAWPQRGFGTWPFFLRAVHGAIFADAAHAWDTTFRAREMRRSFGGELSFDVVLGGALPMTVASGLAFRDDPSGERKGTTGFIRVGRAF